MSKIWSDEEINILKEKYGTITKRELLGFLPGRTFHSITWQASKYRLKTNMSISNRHTKINHNFFAIPNPINSYYAGLFAADGNIKKTTPYCTLNQKDINVLEKFKQHIEYTGKITKRTNSKKKINFCYSVSITSQNITDDLYKNFNIIPQKSLILQPPHKLDNYQSLCFIIGYIDGDGWISIVKTKKRKPYILIGLLGTKKMCEWIKNIFGVGSVFLRKDCKNTIYKYVVSHNNAINIINKLKNIKELDNIRFSRKWDKINEYKFH